MEHYTFMEKLDICPLCRGNHFNEVLKAKDHTVSKEFFTIVRCDSCDFHFTNPRPNATEIGAYYKSEDYISHSNSSKGIINSIYQYVRPYALKGKVKLVASLSQKGKLLDIGCGTGEFLNAAKIAGWDCQGIEPSPEARDLAITKHDLNVDPYESMPRLDDACFDVITMWHVLEHVHHIDHLMKEIQRVLAPGGVLVIAVPNRDSHDANYYSEHWAAWDVPRHLYHFKETNIKRLGALHGFSLDRSIGMKLDSYYVSLLSEKYKTGHPNYFSAFFEGWRSNSAAGKNQNKYSSVIYILRRQNG